MGIKRRITVQLNWENSSLPLFMNAKSENGVTWLFGIDTEYLKSVFKCLVCPDCLHSETLSLDDISVKKADFGKYICLKCHNCS